MSNDRFWNRIRKLYQQVNTKNQVTTPAQPARPPSTAPAPTQMVMRTPVVSPQPVVAPPTQPVQGPQDIAQRVALIHQAGKERKLLEVTYDGMTRLIEPYSFRERWTGRLFYGHCSIHDKIHSFKIEKMENIKITNLTFAPRWDIEL